MSGMVQADSPRADVDARYRRELDAISRMLLGTCVTGHRWNRASGGSLTFEAGTRREDVQAFQGDTFQKRFDKLQAQLEFLLTAYPDLDTLIEEYMSAVLPDAYDHCVTDGERMLRWLAKRDDVTAEQHDFLACQRARHAVEELARAERWKHLRFQECHSVIATALRELTSRSSWRIQLNPIRVWTTFRTRRLVGDETELPAHLLFFARRDLVATALLDLEAQVYWNELVEFSPCTIAQWLELSALPDRRRLLQLTRQLAKLGLIALA
jgi:hypothetical protein